jgi:hypothetical protein
MVLDNNYSNTPTNNFFVMVVLSILPICISLSMIYLYKSITSISVLIFVISLLASFTISTYCALYVFKNKLNSIYKNLLKHSMVLARYRILETEGCGGIQMIERADLIADKEKKLNFNEIWLVSNDLRTEVNDGVYAGAVIYNLNRGIKYKYFIPKSDINDVRIRQLKTESKNNSNLEFYFLKEDFFFLAPDFDFSIYEPNKSRAEGRLAFMGLQLPDSEYLYEVQIHDNLTNSIIEKLQNVIRTTKPI